MQFVIPGKCVIILATLLAAVQAASNNNCGDSTFINQSSRKSPKVTDCQQIGRNIAGDGTWITHAYQGQRTLVRYGTCAFGVTVTSGYAVVGNQDIIDLINSSIQKFTYVRLVASKGTMPCQGGPRVGPVDWGIYHT